MSNKAQRMSWSDARDLFRKWRDESERPSREVISLWESVLEPYAHKLGDEGWLVQEQVFIAALDCNRLDVAEQCLGALSSEFPSSLRVQKLHAMELEAMERYEDALHVLNLIIKADETNAAPRKRKVAILKAQGHNAEAIKELTDYLKKFMSDQEAWNELCNLYLAEQDYARAGFCMEELILHYPNNHLVHQRYAEIKYTQGGFENIETARAYFCQAAKLNPTGVRALYGIFLTSSNIASSPKCPSPKKKEAAKLAAWALKQLNNRYKQKANKTVATQVTALEGLLGGLQISGTT